ncbi:LysM peptidoglycan-binding domain-containing protein [Vibrio ponticus]|uniref:LysM peptidoglycan-binding domain-containing protein n=2 Tax=Vibrio ponticus TaxID=265668 RepID=A0A3N3DVB1_9VIBR|nr:LysM peptidoglycan-binding domain-containing protein [Vibrio ponticus]
MSHEFGMVEADFDEVNERLIAANIPQGMNYQILVEKIKQGEFVLLTEMPSKPAMKFDKFAKSWHLSPLAKESLPISASNALLARSNLSGAVAGNSGTEIRATTSTNIDDTYVPEPIKRDTSQERPKPQFEYNFEIACSDASFRENVSCHFELAKTKQEGVIGNWQIQRTEKGTRYTVYSAIDEPKRLVAKVASNVMGISIQDKVNVRPIGSGVVNEAFIPVVPSVQLGERLGLPTEGYYYHFYQGRLIQEYKVLGEGKSTFFATCSTHEKLDDEQGYNRYQSAILVYWKIDGKEVENQHLLYLDKQITGEELDTLNDEWLAEHGVEINIGELFAAQKQPVFERQMVKRDKVVKTENKPKKHIVRSDLDTSQRETWGAIASQYALSAQQLLDLNPQYKPAPMSLKVDDSLIVSMPNLVNQTQTKHRDLPPIEPSTYNRLTNAYYTYQGNFLGTSVKPITSNYVLNSELILVNLSHVPPQDVDDVYLVFADKKMSVEEFALETYQSKEERIIKHIFDSNSHLKRSFSQIIEGMPLVISPWAEPHPDEAFAIEQANEMMLEFLRRSPAERKWFAEYHEPMTNALLIAAASGLDVYQGEPMSPDLNELNLDHIVAGTGAVIAGAQLQGDKLSKRMKSFADYSHYIAAKTEGLSGPALYANNDYKAWRKEARKFQSEMKLMMSEFGKPGYIKNIQAKRINDYFNVGKRQLYRAKDFSTAISGIDMTSLYKQAMSHSKSLSTGGWLLVGVGLYGNAEDIYKTCEMNGVISESCGRATTQNVTAGIANASVGFAIGYALTFAPVTAGLSIVLVGVGSFAWGMYGGAISNDWGRLVEEVIFD